jgi:hypothetical protein
VVFKINILQIFTAAIPSIKPSNRLGPITNLWISASFGVSIRAGGAFPRVIDLKIAWLRRIAAGKL